SVEQQLKTMQAKYNAQLDRRDSMWLLTEDDQKALDAIYEKDQKTPADETKIKELTDKAKRMSDELQALSQKKDTELSDTEKKKLQDASNQRRDATQRLATMKENLAGELDSRGNTEREAL